MSRYQFTNYLCQDWLATAWLILLLAITGCQPEASGLPPPDKAGKPHADTKLDSRLINLVTIYESKGTQAAQEAAARSGIYMSGEMVRVVIETAQGKADSTLEFVASSGCKVEASSGGLIQALVPAGRIREIAGYGGILYIRLPLISVPAAGP